MHCQIRAFCLLQRPLLNLNFIPLAPNAESKLSGREKGPFLMQLPWFTNVIALKNCTSEIRCAGTYDALVGLQILCETTSFLTKADFSVSYPRLMDNGVGAGDHVWKWMRSSGLVCLLGFPPPLMALHYIY